MHSHEVNLSRPTSVTIASLLLFISLGFYIAGNIVRFYPGPKQFWFILLWIITTVSILIYLFNMISRGKDWARIAFAIFFIISIKSYLELPHWKSLTNFILGILFLSHFALQAFALIFLFQKESSDWFARMRSNAQLSESGLIIPKCVKNAVTLLYVCFGTYLYSDAIRIVAFVLGVGELKLDLQPKSPVGIFVTTHSLIILTIIIIRNIIQFFLIYLTGKGKNWARIIILLSFIISSAEIIWRLPQTSAENLVPLISTVPLLALSLVALVYLFQKESNEWFRTVKIAEQPSYQRRTDPN